MQIDMDFRPLFLQVLNHKIMAHTLENVGKLNSHRVDYGFEEISSVLYADQSGFLFKQVLGETLLYNLHHGKPCTVSSVVVQMVTEYFGFKVLQAKGDPIPNLSWLEDLKQGLDFYSHLPEDLDTENKPEPDSNFIDITFSDDSV